MKIEAKIAALKKSTQDEALIKSLPLQRRDGTLIGQLLPVGGWSLRDESLISAFTKWRKMFMRFFPSQFNATPESMKSYLENLSIARADRILFAVYDVEVGLVGHIGLSNVTAESAELDNIVRGVSGGEPTLMRIAEGTLLSWAFESLGVEQIVAQVLSFNHMAHDLHASFGFVTSESYPLFKNQEGNNVRHNRTDEAGANVKYRLDIITLAKDAFVPL